MEIIPSFLLESGFIFAEFPLRHLYRMTINFPFPLIKSNYLSDSVWHWCLGLCGTLQPFTWRDSASLQGHRDLPWDVPARKGLQEGSLWCWVRHGLMGKHREQDLSWVGAWGRMVAPQDWGNPALLASSEQLALPDTSSGAERQSTAPFTALPFPSRGTEQLSGAFPTCTFPLSGYLLGLSSSPLLKDQPALVPVTGIWAINPFYLWFAGLDAPQTPCRKTRWSLARAGVGGSVPVCFSGTGSDFTGDFRQTISAGN